MYRKITHQLFAFCTLFLAFSFSQLSAQSFSISPSASLTAQLGANDYAALQIDLKNETGAVLSLDWELVSNNLNPAWSVTLCDYQACYAEIINSRTMDPVPPAASGLLRLSINAMGYSGQGDCSFDVWVSGDISSKQTLTFSFDVLTGVDDIASPASFDLFPNPVSQEIHLTLPEGPAGTLHILDATGRHIKTETVRMGTQSTNISTLPAGMYFARIERNGAVSTKQFVKIN